MRQHLLHWKKPYKLLVASGWFLGTAILFFLPGSDLPHEDWMYRIRLDKWVHIGLFAALLFLWSWALLLRKQSSFLKVLLLALLYGILVEVVQYYFIPGRSFDLWDVVADLSGGLMGIWFWNWYKKIDPCRNRGRNQN